MGISLPPLQLRGRRTPQRPQQPPRILCSHPRRMTTMLPPTSSNINQHTTSNNSSSKCLPNTMRCSSFTPMHCYNSEKCQRQPQRSRLSSRSRQALRRTSSATSRQLPNVSSNTWRATAEASALGTLAVTRPRRWCSRSRCRRAPTPLRLLGTRTPPLSRHRRPRRRPAAGRAMHSGQMLRRAASSLHPARAATRWLSV